MGQFTYSDRVEPRLGEKCILAFLSVSVFFIGFCYYEEKNGRLRRGDVEESQSRGEEKDRILRKLKAPQVNLSVELITNEEAMSRCVKQTRVTILSWRSFS